MKGQNEYIKGKEELRELSQNEILFLEIVHNPVIRPNLLDRLQDLGLLSAFLQVENGTN
jgi:UTP:GlnB (protein PII) uridylyltransferase